MKLHSTDDAQPDTIVQIEMGMEAQYTLEELRKSQEEEDGKRWVMHVLYLVSFGLLAAVAFTAIRTLEQSAINLRTRKALAQLVIVSVACAATTLNLHTLQHNPTVRILSRSLVTIAYAMWVLITAFAIYIPKHLALLPVGIALICLIIELIKSLLRK